MVHHCDKPNKDFMSPSSSHRRISSWKTPDQFFVGYLVFPRNDSGHFIGGMHQIFKGIYWVVSPDASLKWRFSFGILDPKNVFLILVVTATVTEAGEVVSQGIHHRSWESELGFQPKRPWNSAASPTVQSEALWEWQKSHHLWWTATGKSRILVGEIKAGSSYTHIEKWDPKNIPGQT